MYTFVYCINIRMNICIFKCAFEIILLQIHIYTSVEKYRQSIKYVHVYIYIYIYTSKQLYIYTSTEKYRQFVEYDSFET
jgi:hypothetical protein